MKRLFVLIWYHFYHCVYLPIFRPKYHKALAEANEELLASLGWIDLDIE